MQTELISVNVWANKCLPELLVMTKTMIHHLMFQEFSTIIGPDPLQRLENSEHFNEEHRCIYYDTDQKIYFILEPHKTNDRGVSYADADVNDNAIIFTEDDFDQMLILFEGNLNSLESIFNLPLLDKIDYCHDESEKEETNQNDSRNPTNNVSVLSEDF
ncbi:hypothetical protein JTB14_006061 [Gonioctena quinquepunctata]|nr:hypothetical protein JTB14_006061 [Gonioctena quinquepunctata]